MEHIIPRPVLRVVRDDERAPTPVDELNILAEMADELAELSRRAEALSQWASQWRAWALERMRPVG